MCKPMGPYIEYNEFAPIIQKLCCDMYIMDYVHMYIASYITIYIHRYITNLTILMV